MWVLRSGHLSRQVDEGVAALTELRAGAPCSAQSALHYTEGICIAGLKLRMQKMKSRAASRSWSSSSSSVPWLEIS